MPAFIRVVLLAAITGSLMAGALLLKGQIWTFRTSMLVIVWGIGGFFGAALTLAMASQAERWGFTQIGTLTRLVGFLPAFAAASSPVYLIQHVLAAGGLELNSERVVRSSIFQSLQLIGLYLYSLPAHLWPWLGVAMMLAGAALLMRVRPKNS
ncbi:hypothetical protein MCEMSEM23_02251 [Rhabdaerophilaceae bacterium]